MGVDPADDRLYIASHHGLFHVVQGRVRRVADNQQDTMGFAVAGRNHFLASGHPGPGQVQAPDHLGLIESTDAARSWSPVSLYGRADLHAIEIAGNRTYAYDAVTGSVLTTSDRDRQSWQPLAQLPVVDLAANPASPDDLLVTTADGSLLRLRRDATPREVVSGPSLVFIEWLQPSVLIGLTPGGSIFVSRDTGSTWRPAGHLGGTAQTLQVSAHAWHTATTAGIVESTDQGKTRATVVRPVG